jgi:hypothetical protein
MKKIIFVVAIAMISVAAFSQNSPTSSITSSDKFQEDETYASSSLGLGLGLDYGGIGIKLSGALSEPVALFAGLGYNFGGVGFNGGFTARLAPKKRIIPTLTAMYGYNAVIKVTTPGEDFNKTFYGPTVGFGLEFHGKYKTKNYFNLEILIPIRSQEYRDTLDDLDYSGVDINELPPIAVSLGYHFGW